MQTDFTLGARTLTTEVAAIDSLTPNQFWEKESLRGHSKEPFRTNEEDRRWQIRARKGPERWLSALAENWNRAPSTWTG